MRTSDQSNNSNNLRNIADDVIRTQCAANLAASLLPERAKYSEELQMKQLL